MEPSGRWKELDKPDQREISIAGPRDGDFDERLFKEQKPQDLSVTGFTSLSIPEAPAFPWAANLRRLDLSSNHLSELPQSVFCSCHGTLSYLDLGSNELDALPSSLLGCGALQTLLVGGNRLEGLPELLLEECTNLAVLHCHSNRLVALPELCPPGSRLADLNLAGNRVSRIPASYVGLVSLDACSNSLVETSAIPEQICSKIKTLKIIKNDFADKKFLKLAEQSEDGDGRITKQLLQLLNAGKSKSQVKKGKPGKSKGDDGAGKDWMVAASAKPLVVSMDREFQKLRPFHAALVLHNVKFGSEEALNDFLKLQLSLMKTRTHVAVGAHDCSRLAFPLALRMAGPEERFHALGAEETAIDALVKDWRASSSKSSYIRKAVDSENRVPVCSADGGSIISLYPVSNGEPSKITQQTSSCYLEVSGVSSRLACEEAMEALVEFAVKELGGDVKIQTVQVKDSRGRLVSNSALDAGIERIMEALG